MTKTTFALADPDTPEDVSLWCSKKRTFADGSVMFRVLNGEWDGRFFPEKQSVLVYYTKQTFSAIKVWEGEIPEKHDYDYTTAIIWIEKQIRDAKRAEKRAIREAKLSHHDDPNTQR